MCRRFHIDCVCGGGKWKASVLNESGRREGGREGESETGGGVACGGETPSGFAHWIPCLLFFVSREQEVYHGESK